MDQAMKDLKNIFENSEETVNESPVVWLKLVRDKLYTMFRSPLKDEYNSEAFKWVASLCISIGDFSWMSEGEKWTPEEAKMFSLIARLSMNEILIILPYLKRHLSYDEEIDKEDGKIMARPADKSEYDAYGNHLVILESTVISLIKNQEDRCETRGTNTMTDSFDPGELQNLLERLKETISEICDHLESCHRHWDVLVAQPNGDKFPALKGSLRIMSLWLSEDPGSFGLQCESFLVDLILKNLLADGTNDKDVYMTALHAICTQKDEILSALLANPIHEMALQRFLDYVQKEREDHRLNRQMEKKFKLRCGLVRDLMSMIKQRK